MTVNPANRVVVPSAGTPTASTSRAAQQGLGKDDFMKLLLAQMKNQDPLKPMEDREMMAQMAQFSALEATQQLSAQMERSMNLQLMSQAGSLVGHHVDAAIGNGEFVSGQVAAVGFLSEGGVVTPRLLVNGHEVDLANVRRVTAGRAGGSPDSTTP